MTVSKRTQLIGACAGLALAAAVLPGAAASGTNSPSVPITGGGVLKLHMGYGGDYFKFLPPTGSSETAATQVLKSKSCVASLSPAASLVTLSSEPGPPGGTVGLLDHSLGVKVAGEGIWPPSCARVDGPSQALTLALAGSLASKGIDFAELDIEALNGVTIVGQAFLGSTPVGTVTLPTTPPATTKSGGPKNDNVRFVINPAQPFDRLVLGVDQSTPGGSFSLEGGSDGTPPAPGGLGEALHTTDSVFQLSDFTGVIDCGGTSGPIGGGSTPQATLDRGQNPDCQPLPFVLRSDDQGVLLQKDASSQQGANFRLGIVWDPEPKPAPGVPLAVTQIDYDGPGGVAPEPVQWCDGTEAAPQLPDGQNWCLVTQSVKIVGGGNVQVSESYYGAGDPRWAR